MNDRHKRIARQALGLAFALLLAPSAILSKEPPDNSNPSKPVNIVLIMADDLGYETIGANGGTSYQTPVLDRLAAEGMRFQHAYSQPL